MERIDKVISIGLCISRTDARRLIKIGKVYIGDTRVKAFDTKVDVNDEITVNGEKLSVQDKVYIIMNKPMGIVCDDKGKFPYAPNTLPEKMRRKDLFCVGRLDKDTTGLLIITNDGNFAHKAISPKSNVKKCYRATLAEPITYENIESAKRGMTLSDGTKLLPADLQAVDETNTVVDFIISEGKYHQIKRMAGAFNNKVLSLHRLSIGQLFLPESLELGQAMVIDKTQAEKIFK